MCKRRCPSRSLRQNGVNRLAHRQDEIALVGSPDRRFLRRPPANRRPGASPAAVYRPDPDLIFNAVQQPVYRVGLVTS